MKALRMRLTGMAILTFAFMPLSAQGADDRQTAMTLIGALAVVSASTPQCGQTDYIAIMDGLDSLAQKGGISPDDAEATFQFQRSKAQDELRDGTRSCAQIEDMIDNFATIGMDLR